MWLDVRKFVLALMCGAVFAQMRIEEEQFLSDSQLKELFEKIQTHPSDDSNNEVEQSEGDEKVILDDEANDLLKKLFSNVIKSAVNTEDVVVPQPQPQEDTSPREGVAALEYSNDLDAINDKLLVIPETAEEADAQDEQVMITPVSEEEATGGNLPVFQVDVQHTDGPEENKILTPEESSSSPMPEQPQYMPMFTTTPPPANMFPFPAALASFNQPTLGNPLLFNLGQMHAMQMPNFSASAETLLDLPSVTQLMEAHHDRIPTDHQPMMLHLDEKEGFYVIAGWFPGVAKEGMKLSLHGNVLHITAQISDRDDPGLQQGPTPWTEVVDVDEDMELPYAPDARLFKAHFDENRHTLVAVTPIEQTHEINLN